MITEPLVVRYERTKQPLSLHRAQVTRLSHWTINSLKAGADAGLIDEIVIIGPNACTGWRIGVNRTVKFVERPTTDERDAIAQRQASMRIVQLEKTT